MTNNGRVVVIGLGNDLRRDDGVGLYVARALRDYSFDHVEIIAGVPDGTSLLDIWDDVETAIVIDAVSSGRPPGNIFRYDGLTEKIPSDIFSSYSTHAINIVAAINLGRTLGRLPARLTIMGIEGNDFSAGEGLSPSVRSAADQLITKLSGRFNNI